LPELKSYLSNIPDRLLITTDFYPKNEYGFHDPNYILTLSEDSARWLADGGLKLYGTSWKSSDYQPGSMKRPIHNILFESAIILECLDLSVVPEGDYYIFCNPVNIEGSSEVPVNPLLLSKDELINLV
jgi:arylformamidase